MYTDDTVIAISDIFFKFGKRAIYVKKDFSVAVALTPPNPTKSLFSTSELDDGREMQNVQLDIIVKQEALNRDHVRREHMVSNQKPCRVRMDGHHQIHLEFQKDFGSKVVIHVRLDSIVMQSI